MLHLIIGGSSQGKLAYALQITKTVEPSICDGETCNLDESIDSHLIDHVHFMLRRLPQAEEPYAAVTERWLEQLRTRLSMQPDLDVIIILDDVGCGVVPLDPQDRKWRDRCGRFYCQLTTMADRVDRIWAGLPQRLK